MSQRSPRGFRLHIGLFGRRNVGKSSLLNAITRQQVSIVSDQAGTTTDPVEKPMELLPLGPVLFIDTAGIDDIGALGQQRVERTRQVFDRTDLGILVTESGQWASFEDRILEELAQRDIPCIVVVNKIDLQPSPKTLIDRCQQDKIPLVQTSVEQGKGLSDLRQAILNHAPEDFINQPAIVADLVGPGQMAVLVVPIDKEAPKGRLILPQVQTIRDLLDNDSLCVVVKERELRAGIENLKQRPKLVVTDSQAFLKVAADTPADVPMTSFSILFARFKGDLTTQTLGAMAVEKLQPGDNVLIAEACSHHPIGEDIGRVKIPRWLTQYVGGKLNFTTVQGQDFPDDLSDYKLVIHCGACMLGRMEMIRRIKECRRRGVAITNYGVAISKVQGLLDRVLAPFGL